MPVTFVMNVEDDTQVIELDVTAEEGGPYAARIGTDGDDAIVAGDVDTAIRGRGGDDSIDVSADAVHTVIFEPTQDANGSDEITGFSLGEGSALPDRIAFAGLDNSTLRGEGTDAQIIEAGESIGANTGFVVFSTIFGEDDDAAVLEALGDLGLEAGDSVYGLLATDEGNSFLARVDADADGALPTDLEEISPIAEFTDIGDLTGFTADNLIGFTLQT